jgi:hypothetical protein
MSLCSLINSGRESNLAASFLQWDISEKINVGEVSRSIMSLTLYRSVECTKVSKKIRWSSSSGYNLEGSSEFLLILNAMKISVLGLNSIRTSCKTGRTDGGNLGLQYKLWNCKLRPKGRAKIKYIEIAGPSSSEQFPLQDVRERSCAAADALPRTSLSFPRSFIDLVCISFESVKMKLKK